MVKDIILSDYDLVIENGDFKISDSDKQHLNLIIKTYVGSYKDFPLLGVGIDYYLASSNQQLILKSNIITQLVSDSYKVGNINVIDKVYSFDLDITADRITQK